MKTSGALLVNYQEAHTSKRLPVLLLRKQVAPSLSIIKKLTSPNAPFLISHGTGVPRSSENAPPLIIKYRWALSMGVL